MALFTNVVQGPTGTTAAVANATALPSLTLPQSARMLTRVWVTGSPTNFNVAEPWLGYVRITSDDCSVEPLNIPFEIIPGFITVASGVQREPHKWIVNCSVPGGAVLDADVVLDVGQTAAGEVQVTYEFSDGGSPFGGQQLHMKSAEPRVALGTAADAAISLTNIEIKASRLVGIWGYAIQLQPTADQSCNAEGSITSDDFAQAGPFAFGWNAHAAGIANSASGGVDLTLIETDRPFRHGGQKQTLSCVTTTRDAMTGNGEGNWGVIYH